MENSTLARTREAAPRCLVAWSVPAVAAAWPGRPTPGFTGAGAPTAAFQGGAIAALGFAHANDQMVTDHKYSTRLGSSSCSPPV